MNETFGQMKIQMCSQQKRRLNFPFAVVCCLPLHRIWKHESTYVIFSLHLTRQEILLLQGDNRKKTTATLKIQHGWNTCLIADGIAVCRGSSHRTFCPSSFPSALDICHPLSGPSINGLYVQRVDVQQSTVSA